MDTNENKKSMNLEEIKYCIGRKIRQKRTMMNISREELGQNINLTANYLRLVEKGKGGLSIEKLLKAANFFNISLDELTGFSDISIDKNNSNEFQNQLSKVLLMSSVLDDSDIHFICSFVTEFILYKDKKLSMTIIN